MTSAAQSLRAVQAAFYFAKLHRTPVLLNVPMNIQDEEYPEAYDYVRSRAVSPPSTRIVPDADRSA